LIDIDGTVLGESDADRLTMDNHLYRPEVQEALANGQGSDTRFSNTIGEELIYGATRVEWEGEVVGVARVAISYESFQSYLAQMTQLITGITAILVIIFVIISIIISDNHARPIQEIAEKVQAMDAGNFSYTISHTRSKELHNLNTALNNMGEQFTTALAAINSEKNRLSIVLEQMADGALITNHLGIVEYINPAAVQLLETEQGFYAIEIKQSRSVREGDARHLKGLSALLDKPLLHAFLVSHDPELKQFGNHVTAIPAPALLS
jgi:two-component system phosphate regulon sensor histidine kinase PhoR